LPSFQPMGRTLREKTSGQLSRFSDKNHHWPDFTPPQPAMGSGLVASFCTGGYIARGERVAPPAMRQWAVQLETMPKNVVSSTRTAFPWTNSHHLAGDLRTSVQQLIKPTPGGVLLGSGKLANATDRLDLIDEYQSLIHPRIGGHGPTLYQGGLPSTRRLELISAKPLRSGSVAMHYRRACS
jgi:dihydrofolate reductase